jgi:predicted nucleic acid-binding protein
MNDDVVLDASVVANLFFPKAHSVEALSSFPLNVLRSAPDLIFAEFVSVATRLVRRGLVSKVTAGDAVARLPLLIDEIAPVVDLASSAYDLTTRYGFSAYDSVYLALAVRRDRLLVTADAKLAIRAIDIGMADHVRLLTAES